MVPFQGSWSLNAVTNVCLTGGRHHAVSNVPTRWFFFLICCIRSDRTHELARTVPENERKSSDWPSVHAVMSVKIARRGTPQTRRRHRAAQARLICARVASNIDISKTRQSERVSDCILLRGVGLESSSFPSVLIIVIIITALEEIPADWHLEKKKKKVSGRCVKSPPPH